MNSHAPSYHGYRLPPQIISYAVCTKLFAAVSVAQASGCGAAGLRLLGRHPYLQRRIVQV